MSNLAPQNDVLNLTPSKTSILAVLLVKLVKIKNMKVVIVKIQLKMIRKVF